MPNVLTIRVYFPPGYDENTLKRYPVIYMHDGNNLFFPEEAHPSGAPPTGVSHARKTDAAGTGKERNPAPR